MGDKLDQLFKLDLGKLNFFGWLLFLVSLAVAFGGPMVLVSAHSVEFDSDHPRSLRGPALLCWFAAAAIFFGGRSVLDLVGLGIYRNGIKGPRTRPADKPKVGIVVGVVALVLVFFMAYQATKGSRSGNSVDAKRQRTARMTTPSPAAAPSPAIPPIAMSSPVRTPSPRPSAAARQRAPSATPQPTSFAQEFGPAASTAAVPRPDEETDDKNDVAAMASPAEFRTWTDSTGKFKIQAQLISASDGKATLKRKDGEIVEVQIEKLSPLDRAFLDSAAPAPRRVTTSGGDTELVGGKDGFPFRYENQGPLLGIRCRLGAWDNERTIGLITPVFNRNEPAMGQSAVIARQGYAVGALNVDAERFVNALQLVFMRQESDGRLDPSDSYTSEWIGFPTRRPTTTLDGSGAAVVGIHGRRGAVLDAVGLILRGD